MNKKLLLYITAFFCGVSVMAVELGASRLLAPYFSSSQIVWTIIIGTIMIAMAVGNVLGGKMADKYNNPNRMFAFVFAAACWIALIPVFGKFIIAGVALLLATFVTANYLVWAALVSCLLVFVFPLLVMGMVTPNLVKFAVDNLDENGKVTGTIEALNTIGSIIGTFLPTFVTIPFVGTSWTFIIFAIILFTISLTYFIAKCYKRIKYGVICGIVLIIGILGSNIGVVFWQSNTLYEGESIYNYLRVEETNDSYILSTNVLFGVQSVKMKEDGLTGMYYDYALAGNAMARADGVPDILILGLGTGTFAYQTKYYFGEANIDGVEIDEKIVKLARRYFSLPQDVNVHVTDGRAFLSATDKKYDVILVDAYQDITIPFQMSSIEFFTEVKEHLEPDGVMVVNMNMYSSKNGGINDYLCGTIKRVFDTAYGIKLNSGNYELFASDGFNCKEKLTEYVSEMPSGELKSMLKSIDARLEVVEDNDYILTDDKAPVELLGMKVLDDMIFAELDYYKSILKGKSLKDIIKMVLNGEMF